MISFFTRDGRMTNLEKLCHSDISIEEIANSLANQGRYNGQTWEFYSVAQHSVLLSEWAENNGYPIEVQRALLLHDASEAFCGDIVYHLKQRLEYFRVLEENILSIIFDKYGIEYDKLSGVVHWLDRSICIDEMSRLMNRVDPQLMDSLKSGSCTRLNITIIPQSPTEARESFINRAKKLNLTD